MVDHDRTVDHGRTPEDRSRPQRPLLGRYARVGGPSPSVVGNHTGPPAVIIDKLHPAHHQRAGIDYRMRGDLKHLRTEQVDAAIISAQPGWRRRGSGPL